MQRRDESGLIAICLTLAIHAGLAYLLVCAFIKDQDFLLHYNPPAQLHYGRGYVGIMPFTEPEPAPPKPPEKTQPQLPPEPKPRPQRKEEQAPAPNDFGEANGSGTAINSFKADKPFQGRKGDQDQAFLSRDPVGPGRLPPVPSAFTGLPGELGDNRPKRPAGPGGDGTPPVLASLIPPSPQTPTPFGPNANPEPAIPPAPKFVAPPPTPPPPPPIATTPPVQPPADMIAIAEPGGPTTHPVDPAAPKRPANWIAQDLPPGPQTSVRPKLKLPATRPNDTTAEVPPSPKTLVASPATRPSQIALDKQVHPESPKPSPATQPSKLVQSEADPAKESQPKPTTQPVEVAMKPVLPSPTPPLSRSEAQTAPKSERAKQAAANPGPGGSSGGGGRAGPPIASADPAPMSDQESDAFSTKGTIIIEPGKIEARLGRKVKPIKPRLPLKGQVDVASLENPGVVMKVSIDPTGKVTDVRTLRSSGSNEIDHPTELALYQWWIEPAKNKQGKPIKDVIVLTIGWR